MANDRVLRATVTIDAKKGIETLKQVEKQGNQTVATITRNGQLISRSVTNITGQTATAVIRTNTAWTALNTSWTAGIAIAGQLNQMLGGTVRFLKEAAQASWEDTASTKARDAAVMSLTGSSEELIGTLDRQVEKYQKLYGIGDDVTRGIQQLLAEYRLAPGLIEQATAAITAQGIKAVALTNFLDKTTDKIKGTTIAVKENASEQERLQAVIEGTSGSMAALEAAAKTGQGAFSRLTQATSELKETLGSGFNTSGVIDSINNITAATWGLNGVIQAGINGMNLLLSRKPSGVSPSKLLSGMGLDTLVPGFSGFNRVLGLLGNPGFQTGVNMMNYSLGLLNEEPPQFSGIEGTIAPATNVGGGGGGRGKKGRTENYDPNKLKQDALSIMVKARERAHELVKSEREFALSGYRALLSGDTAVGADLRMPGAGAPRTMGQTGLAGRDDVEFAGMAGVLSRSLMRKIRERGMEVEQPLSRMQLIGNQFNGQGIAALAGSVMGGGGIRGFLGTAGALAGNAFGPLGSALGGIVGGGLGKLLGGIFGGGRKRDEDRGLVPGKPIYVEDQQLRDEIARLGNIIRVNLLGGGGSNIDMATRNLAMQRARAGG